MADLKISQLTGASTPLAGTEVLPIVQSGSTVKVSVANLTAGRTQTSNGIVQGTAATGYNFTANTPAAGMTSQLLNWYEEGTWTPTYASSNGNMTIGSYDVRDGRYVRIGRQVIVTFAIATATVSAAGTGFVIITGLPFTLPSSSTNSAGSIGYSSNGFMTACYIATNTAEIRISGHTSTSAQSTIDRASTANFQGTGSFNNYLIGTLTYFM